MESAATLIRLDEPNLYRPRLPERSLFYDVLHHYFDHITRRSLARVTVGPAPKVSFSLIFVNTLADKDLTGYRYRTVSWRSGFVP